MINLLLMISSIMQIIVTNIRRVAVKFFVWNLQRQRFKGILDVWLYLSLSAVIINRQLVKASNVTYSIQ